MLQITSRKKYIPSLSILSVSVAVILLLFAVGSCQATEEYQDGVYGAYYGLPDEHGWNDEVWIEVESGSITEAFSRRRSAFGDVSDAQELDLDEYEGIEAADIDRNDPTGIPPLFLRALDSARQGETGFSQVHRSHRYVQESFEPDADGVLYRFSVVLDSDPDEEGAQLPEYSRINGEEVDSINLTDEFDVTPEQLQETITAAYPIEHPVELYNELELLGDSYAAERLRALILRTAALTRVQQPTESSADTDSSRSSAPYNDEAGVVSSHFLATEAGLEILDAGGNAADAAAAVAAALSVVEPWFSSSVGGGTWALYYNHSAGTVHSQDGVGPAAAGNTAEAYAPLAGETGLHQSLVPGAWGGWMVWLQEFGRLPLDQVLEPAIRLASDGFPASAGLVEWLGQEVDDIRADRPDTEELYLPDGSMPSEGDTLYNAPLAETFQRLADTYTSFAEERGHRGGLAAAGDYYYRGPLAEKITSFSDQNDGRFALSDFTDFYGEIVDPISIDYNGIEVFQNPPNSQGITQLMALNILKDFDFSRFNGPSDPDAVHLITEAMKLAHIDKYYHVGDPDWVDVPVGDLLSEDLAAERREQIDMNTVITWPVDNILPVDPELAHTSTFQIVDDEGNAVSTTTSLGAQFYVVGDTGIHINNRMRMMSVEEGDPNRVEPGKKVRHTSNPYMALQNGVPYILGGNTGVDTQPQVQTQQVIWIVEFGMTPQEAVSHPRFITRAFPNTQHPWTAGNDLGMEDGTPQELIDAMQEKGHQISDQGVWGNGNMIVINPDTGNIDLGADPRGENKGEKWE